MSASQPRRSNEQHGLQTEACSEHTTDLEKDILTLLPNHAHLEDITDFKKEKRKSTAIYQVCITIQALISLGGAIWTAVILDAYNPLHPQSTPPLPPDALRFQQRNSIRDQNLRDLTPSTWIMKAAVRRSMTIFSSHRISRITSLHLDPPPLLFLCACIIFSLAIDTHLADRDRHRKILGAGMIFRMTLSIVSGDGLMKMKGILVWGTILGLILSSVFHWVGLEDVRRRRDDGNVEAEGG